MQKSNLAINSEDIRANYDLMDIYGFKKQHKLIKKADRYNLILKNYNLEDFAQQFKFYNIEDLNLTTIENSVEKTIKEYEVNFNEIFEGENLTQNHIIINFSGYFKELDFYFYSESEILHLEFIAEKHLQFVLDLLFEDIHCELRNRLITEMLIDLEFTT